ncbi:50S ribosomal protein L10 [Duncaniella freteri]|jgi:large subunit ribosomal protein L10|uniref:Large ribosomal subunit protein uL10 n=1 Tax=Duncaniella freteri TaxID=2530391 RepID=A0A4Z0V7V3_9BACT|nr:50S ribosomal protein L10 [Duncaniella freteri]MCX4370086.1 50S ribosomal protein L10 [Duncaniella sp.]NBJ07111.1 50S ribosomal protein L10 [Alistipes sp. Z76]NCE69179.1 50S ribosomal protein L10 [Muribaculaceae bacterium M3]MDE7027779.1 50S ribosomal protein L10 [Duncaniella freteri]TGG40307.1 50S ribosomal protein L10 [Duncaniella freteri]
MKKEDKIIAIQNIAKTIQEYGCFYLVETAGLDAEKTTALRRACNNAEVKLMVVKNTLLHKALESLEGDYSELYGALHGSTSLMLSNVGNAPAKLIKEFVKGDKDAKLPAFKAAYVEETVYVGADQLSTLEAIKSKNELIADVIALLQSPAKNVVSGLQSGANKLHGILETLSQKEA